MYQRYFKQRKFGRVFSFALVVGSGLSHYFRQSKQLLKNLFSLETLTKFDQYLPSQVEATIEHYKTSIKDSNLKENKENVENKLFKLKNNLNRFENIQYKDANNIESLVKKRNIKHSLAVSYHYNIIYSEFPKEKYDNYIIISYLIDKLH
jgi:Na+/phosphate symporter